MRRAGHDRAQVKTPRPLACAVAILAVTVASPSALGASRLEHVSWQSGPGRTRVVLHLQSPVTYKSAWLRDPDRLYLDLEGVDLAPQLENYIKPVGDSIVK